MTQARSVSFFDHTAVPSGGELAMVNLLGALNPQRWQPSVILGQAGPLVTRLQQEGRAVDVIAMPSMLLSRGRLGAGKILDPIRLLSGLGYAGRLARHLRKTRPALLHANSLRACVVGSLAARRAGMPSIWHIHSLVAQPLISTAGVRLIRGLARRLPAHIICNSKATASCLNLPPDRVTVIATGVDPGRFTPNGRARHEPLRIGMVGRFAPWKGQHVFVDAAGALAARFPEAEFVLAGAPLFGEESYLRAVREQAGRMENHDQIRFMDFVDDVPALLRDLDVVVHASVEPEPFGQVVVEAMMAEKPIVASAAGGPMELVEDGVTGRLVEPGNANALAEALESVILDSTGSAAMGRRARAHAIDHYDIHQTARAVEQVYERVLTGA